MQSKRNIDARNIIRMREIAEIYAVTKQTKKSERYHKIIIRICDRYPKNEMMLIFKLESLNCLNRTYKSLETTNDLLKVNPYNTVALINIANHLKEEKHAF